MVNRQTDTYHYRTLCAAALMAAASLLPLPAFAQGPPDIAAPSDNKDRYIISFLPNTTAAQRAEAARLAGAMPLADLGLIHGVAVSIPDINVLAALQGLPLVVKVVPDHRIFAFQTNVAKSNGGASNLTGGSAGLAANAKEAVPAGVKRVGEPVTGAEGAGVGVMIGDTGIDWTHEDLRVAPERFDAFGGNCLDLHGHGTHVAGTVAALKNGIGVVGVAPGATLYCGKVLADNGSGSDSNIIELLQWVVRKNAEGISPQILVVNLSLGREIEDGDIDGPLREAVQAAHKAGVTVIVAAGNDPNIEVKDQVPSGFPEVIAVASITAEDGNPSRCPFVGNIAAGTASYFTTDGALDPVTGIGVSISAPGGTRENVNPFCRITCEGILSTGIGGGTTQSVAGSAACGTSMASPHVAGLAARIIEAGITGPEGVRNHLRQNSDRAATEPLDSPGAAYTYDGEREGVAIWRP